MWLITVNRHYSNRSGGCSNLRGDQAHDKAWRLAVSGGYEFEKDDFLGWRPGDFIEELYRLGVERLNRSACIAIEKALERKPFIYENKRLYVGSRTLGATVTSFAKDGQSLIACTYHGSVWGEKCKTCGRREYLGNGKIKRRIRKTHKEIQEAEKERKRVLAADKRR